MTKSSQVIFQNELNQRVAITPINSSRGQWDGFKLAPGESDSIINSLGGSGNYDIEFRIRVEEQGKDNDVVIGEFRVDNPWIGDEYTSSLTDDIWFGESYGKNPRELNGKKYYTQYFSARSKVLREKPGRLNDGDSGIFGRVERNDITEITRDESKDQYTNRVTRYYSELPNAAFQQFAPLIQAKNIGDDSGSKTWNFHITDSFS